MSISARAVAANATGLVAAANSSVEIDPLGDAYDVVVAELAEDPLGAGEAPTSRVVRVGAFAPRKGGGASPRIESKHRW